MKATCLVFIITTTCCNFLLRAQTVGIGTQNPNASAILEVQSTNKGLLLPRMTMAQRNDISSPIAGLLIYQTDNTTGFYFYNGSGWVQLAAGGATNYWSANGSHIFKNNAGNVGLGTNNPGSLLTLQTALNNTGFTHIAGNNEIIVAEAIGTISASVGTASNHAFRIMTNNTGRLHVYAAGEVVVGGNSTASFGKLTVETSNNNYGIAHTSVEGNILSTRIGGTSAGIGTFSNTNMRLFANSNSALIIDAANGNIGIGTEAPTAKLHVSGNQKIDGSNTLEFGAGAVGKEQNAGKIGYAAFTSATLDIIGAGNSISSRAIKFWNEGGATFTGNIGIGTNPSFGVRLHINQDVEALRLSGNQPYMTFFNGADYKGYLRSIGANDMEFGTAPGNTNGKLNLSVKGISYFSINSNGQVAINGNPAPFKSPKFTTNGIFAIVNNSTEWTFEAGDCFSPGGPCLLLYGNGFLRARLEADGDWISVSDKRFKENIQVYKTVLPGVKNLKIATYHLKFIPGGKPGFGLIAQDVAQYFPEIVSENLDRNGETVMGIAYAKTGVLALKAVQEQQAIIENQQQKIKVLEEKLDRLEKLVSK